jgi:hypothetical protein
MEETKVCCRLFEEESSRQRYPVNFLSMHQDDVCTGFAGCKDHHHQVMQSFMINCNSSLDLRNIFGIAFVQQDFSESL